MSSDLYEVILDGGGPWGIRLQGGKDFGIPLNIARVTPGSKAANKRLIDGDQIMEINYTPTETLTHMEAQNIIKNAGDKLQLKLKPGKGVSLGEIKQVGSGAFAANPSQTLYVTETVHSADVDHKYNAKPRAFGTTEPTASAAVSGKKFDPAEYARKKKEELEKYKEEKNNPKEIDSDVLKMLQNTHVNQGQGSFARLENQLQHEGTPQPTAFRMTAEGTDLTDDLPPPPPDMFDHEHEAPKSGGTFKSMQHHIEAGTADEIKTVFSQPPGQRGQPIYAGPPKKITSPQGYVNPAPKSSMASGPNFKVGKAAAPTFKANPVQTYLSKPPPPPAVNAQEIQNPNSRLLSNSQYPSPQQTYESNKPSSPTNSYQQPVGGPGRFSPQSYGNPPPQPAGNINKIMTKGSPQSTTVTPQKGLVCHACEQPLIGPFVSAIGRTWHPEHFCCSACNTSLQNQAFVEENNSLYCEKCYNQYFAPKCAHCNNAIIGNCINALGKSWHPDHFVCSFCSRSFGNDGFLVDSGRPYCEQCHEHLFSVKCGRCARAITGGEKYVEALNKNWHSECFVCEACNIRLEGNSFFVSRGSPFCQNHKMGY
ncbi:PDZ and LIM domain protein 7 isoform X7 [Hydra vulgaris]|uniref:PDZ and LIM domain protein 7 isoform X7 n=1 Tax=Hydra vulgaris TaxID=6087 RepID=A0ABM4BYJ9_HYDVU